METTFTIMRMVMTIMGITMTSIDYGKKLQ